MTKGNNYNVDMTVDEVRSNIKKQLKKEFPKAKWSVRKNYHKAFTVSLISWNNEVLIDKVGDGVQIYGDAARYKDLTDKGIEIMNKAQEIINSYNYDDSDAMTDYFDTKFYFTLEIGKYNKDYQVK